MLRFTENIIGQVTRDCNLRCKYCYEAPGMDPRWKGKHMDFETFKWVLDSIIYNRCILGTIENKINFHLHGGEFLLVPNEDIKKFIEYIEERSKFFPGLMWCSQSNGTLLTEDMAKFFVEHNASFGFSFDGFDIDDRMSPKKNHELMDKFRKFKNELGLRCSFIMVLKKKNMKTWIQDAKSCLDFSDHVGINILCATSDEDIPTLDEQWEYWYKPVLESFLTDDPIKERNVIMMCAYAMQSLLYNVDKMPKTGCFSRICAYGSNMISVDPNLNMHGCDKHLDYGDYAYLIEEKPINSLDFLGFQTVKTVMDHLKKMSKIEKELGCDRCRAKDLCPGECQAYNISRWGDVKLDKSFCNLYKKIYNFIEDNWIEILEHVPIMCIAEPTEITSYARRKLEEAHKKIYFEYDKIKIMEEK